MMQELIDRITQATGLDASMVQSALGSVLSFLNKEGPQDSVGKLMDAIPGSSDLVAQAGEQSGGLLGSVMGMFGGAGGVMALGTQLMQQGLSMDQVTTLAQELFGYGKEKVGEDVIGQIASQIPGLSKFV
jgi:hypothetical protein